MIEINGTEKYIMKFEFKGMVLMTKIDGMTKIDEIGKLTLKSKLKDKVTMTKINGTKKILNGKWNLSMQSWWLKSKQPRKQNGKYDSRRWSWWLKPIKMKNGTQWQYNNDQNR